MSWFQTHARVEFDLAAPRADMVRAADIAHSSSLICRFNGHTRTHWPLAQHAVMIAAAAWHRTRDRLTAAIGLLHDGAEPYTGDISAPMKWLLEQRAPGALKRIEREVLAAVCEWAQLPGKPTCEAIQSPPADVVRAWSLVGELDRRALFHDRDHMLGTPIRPWVGEDEVEPLGPQDVGAVAGDEVWNPLTTPWTASVAESVFNYALAALVPLGERDRRTAAMGSHSYPPSWLIPALRRVLPRPPAGL